MEVGTILVADVKTSAGNYCNFFVVSSLVKKTFYAKRMRWEVCTLASQRYGRHSSASVPIR